MYYSETELLDRCKTLPTYKGVPHGYWIICVRRALSEQKPNEFNDVFYLMLDDKILETTTCTTVAGLPALRGGYKRYNSNGAAVLAADTFMYDAFKYGMHKGRMRGLRQRLPLWGYRDNNNNSLAEEIGERIFRFWYTNIHASSYKYLDRLVRKYIGHWSYGCIVCNNRIEYDHIMDNFVTKQHVTCVILNEFSI